MILFSKKQTLLCALLFIIGIGRIIIQVTAIQADNLHKALTVFNASPLVTPFTGYSNNKIIEKLLEYEIYFDDETSISGSHFEKIYQIRGLHSQRIKLINLSRQMIHSDPPSIPQAIHNFYCKDKSVISYRLLLKKQVCSPKHSKYKNDILKKQS